MKFAKALLVSTMFISTATAFAGGFGEGYYNGLPRFPLELGSI